MTFFILAFVAGFLTVLAPCVLPLLPVIIGGAVSDNKNRLKPYVIIISLAISLIVFTLLLKWSSAFVTIPQSVWQMISGGILIVFALTLLFPNVWAKLTLRFNLNLTTNKWLASGYQKKNWLGDVIIGAALGPVFSTCSPTYFVILATVLPASFGRGLLDLTAYVLGLSLVLLAIALLGQRFVGLLDKAADPEGWFKRSLGILFLIIGLGIIGGYDKILEASILTSGYFDITKVENKLLQQVQTKMGVSNVSVDGPTTTSNSNQEAGIKTGVFTSTKQYPRYVEITNPSGFVNSQPFKLADLIGKKVILVDFMTYSCINCQRTFPYLNSWYSKYQGKGLEIVAIHTPEFAFEKDINNVKKAMLAAGIKFPVVLDNDYGTWNAYQNSYWPRKYLIDIHGNVVYDHIGEGQYEETEQKIQELLKEKMMVDGTWETIVADTSKPVDVPNFSPSNVQTPELYFGSARNKYLGNAQPFTNGTQDLTLPQTFEDNTLYLSGAWNFVPEYAQAKEGGEVVLSYSAKNVYAVASGSSLTKVAVYRDNQLIKTVDINDETLYTLIEGQSYGDHILKLKVFKGELKLFTLTFG